MTAQVEEERGPIWFFVSKDNALVQNLPAGARAHRDLRVQGPHLFASIQGALRLDQDRATIDRLWNPYVAAWYEGEGRPQARLLRLDAERAEI
jgi:general stress protein 26